MIAAPVVVLGAILLVIVLAALQKKLRIFTKGTVAFMVIVLMIVAAVDVVDALNDIRNSEFRVNSVATKRVIQRFLSNCLADDESPSLTHVDATRTLAIEDDITQLRSVAPDCVGGELVAIMTHPPVHVWGWHDSPFRGPGYHAWPYRALYDENGKYRQVSGRVYTYEANDDGRAVICGVDGELTPLTMSAKALYRSAFHRNPDYKRQLRF